MTKTTEERLNDIELQLKELNDIKKKDSIQDIIRRLLMLEKRIEVVSVAPTSTPVLPTEYFKIYVNSTTYRLYVYVNGTWRYTNLT
jgi:hypothetical protein